MQEDKTNTRWASSLNVLAGIWLIVSPYILGFSTSSLRLNDIYVGIVIGALALIRAIVVTQSSRWLSWVNMVLGAWLIVSPFILHFTYAIHIWNDIILGILVILFGAWSASGYKVIESAKQEEQHAHEYTHR
jgi:hypothetical protein